MSDQKENPALVQMRDDMQVIVERAHAIGCRGGGVAYAAYMLDLMRAGDRHMRTEPLTLDDITDGIWWTRWKDSGEYEAVLVEESSSFFGVDKQVREFGSSRPDRLDAEFLEDRDFICRIPEPRS